MLKSLDPGVPVDCNALIYVYLHANVYDLNNIAQTSYGGGICYNSGDKENPLNAWFCKSDYQAQCPSELPPPSGPGDGELICETAFAYGTHVLARRFNPDSLLQYEHGMKTNRWGWFTLFTKEDPVAEKSFAIYAGAGRNRIGKAADIGVVVYTYSTEDGVPSVEI